MHLNVDCGEGMSAAYDLSLLAYVDQVNIACGGHAGDPAWSQELAAQAWQQDKEVAVHPGYPDRENFGRVPMAISWQALKESLSTQRAVLPRSTRVKFHGALYNAAMADASLAQQLADWCVEEGMQEVLAMPDSALAEAARSSGLQVVLEGFADRAYDFVEGQVRLRPRSEPGALIADPAQALLQMRQVSQQGQLTLATRTVPYAVDTWCVHGDSPAAYQFLQALRRQL